MFHTDHPYRTRYWIELAVPYSVPYLYGMQYGTAADLYCSVPIPNVFRIEWCVLSRAQQLNRRVGRRRIVPANGFRERPDPKQCVYDLAKGHGS